MADRLCCVYMWCEYIPECGFLKTFVKGLSEQIATIKKILRPIIISRLLGSTGNDWFTECGAGRNFRLNI